MSAASIGKFDFTKIPWLRKMPLVVFLCEETPYDLAKCIRPILRLFATKKFREVKFTYILRDEKVRKLLGILAFN